MSAKGILSRHDLVAVVLVAIGAVMLWACASSASRLESLTVDFPHGELRLLVRPDGDLRLFYGALPSSQAVKRGTFDLDALSRRLRPLLHDVAPAEARPVGPYGMVSFRFRDGSERKHLIYDRAAASELFAAACANRVPGSGRSEDIFSAACAELGSIPP